MNAKMCSICGARFLALPMLDILRGEMIANVVEAWEKADYRIKSELLFYLMKN